MSLSIPQQDVGEGNDLQCLAQPHAVSEDAAEATAGLIPLQRLNEVIVEEPDSPDLRNEETNDLLRGFLFLSLYVFERERDGGHTW